MGVQQVWEKGLELEEQGFPGDLVIRNPPANAGDVDSIPGPRRSHMPRSNKVVCHNC